MIFLFWNHYIEFLKHVNFDVPEMEPNSKMTLEERIIPCSFCIVLLLSGFSIVVYILFCISDWDTAEALFDASSCCLNWWRCSCSANQLVWLWVSGRGYLTFFSYSAFYILCKWTREFSCLLGDTWRRVLVFG